MFEDMDDAGGEPPATAEPWHWWLAAAVIVLLLAALMTGSLVRQVRAADAPSKGEWYRSLVQPGTGASCCDVADCAPARAAYTNGHWVVAGPDGPLDVPPDRILDREPFDGISAYACIVGGKVYCFVRPGTGG
jgi:hypothetical protein